MKGLKENKKRVLGFALVLVMVVSAITSGNMFEVKAEGSNTYTPYYDATDGKVYGCPEVGTQVLSDTVFSGEKLDDMTYVWICLWDNENKEGWSTASFTVHQGETITLDLGEQPYYQSYGWIMESCSYNEFECDGEVFEKQIYITGYFKESKPEIDEIDLFLDWTKLSSFQIGENVSNATNSFVKQESEEPSFLTVTNAETAFVGLAIKPTEEHVKAGYISQEMYENSTWLSAYYYGSEYKINENDEYAVQLYMWPADGHTFSTELVYDGDDVNITEKFNVKPSNVNVIDAYAYYWASGEQCDVMLYLGTGADIVESINPSTQGPTTPPTTDDEEPTTPPTTDDEEPTTPPATDGEVSDVTTNDYNAQLENESDVETKIELTEDEKSAIASGEELEVVLVFTDEGTKVDTDEKKAIEKQLGDNSLGVFLDIELIKKIGSTEVEVSETTGLITITFDMPEELKNKDTSVVRTYKVMRYHEGKVDVLDAKYDSKTGKLSFDTDKFSTYAIVYSDTKANSTTTSTPAPQTGDTTNTFVYIALLCFAMCSIVLVLRKQRKF